MRNNLGEDYFDFTEQIFQLAKDMFEPKTIEQYAISVIGHLENRIYSYIYDKKDFDYNLNKVLR